MKWSISLSSEMTSYDKHQNIYLFRNHIKYVKKRNSRALMWLASFYFILKVHVTGTDNPQLIFIKNILSNAISKTKLHFRKKENRKNSKSLCFLQNCWNLVLEKQSDKNALTLNLFFLGEEVACISDTSGSILRYLVSASMTYNYT